jgi:NADH-quinone oxidoreductase subunit N
MGASEILALFPCLVLAVTAIAAMLFTAVRRSHQATAIISLAGLALSLVSLPFVSSVLPLRITSLLILDPYAFFFMGLIFAATFATAVFSYGYLEKCGGVNEEFYVLLLLAAFGASVLVSSAHFVSLFFGLEILSISLYALLAYRRVSERGIEAGIKYLVLAAASSAFLTFGMALVYAELGTMEFSSFAAPTSSAHSGNIIFLAGTALILAGLGFKLALVPFHMWTPDVYQGAPAPVTAFVATVSKGAVFALLLRFLGNTDVALHSYLFSVISVISMASMTAGNLLALLQDNVKRMLAYSSIAHLGYLLVAFLAGGAIGLTASAFYLVAYFVTTLGAFGVITLLSHDDEADSLTHYRSLAWNRPWMAAIFSATLLSLAGIPLTAGFLAKFYLLASGVSSGLWLLIAMLVTNSALGLFYYLRVIAVMVRRPEGKNYNHLQRVPSPSRSGNIMLGALLFLLVWLGIYPGPLIEFIQKIIVSR